MPSSLNSPQRSLIKPIAPAIKQQHLQESSVLGDCNEQMNNYLQRAIDLEREQNALKNAIEKIIESWGEETKRVKKENEPKLENARAYADEHANDVAKVIAKVNRQDSEMKFLQKSLADDLKANAADSEKLNDLKQIHEQNADELDSLKQSIAERQDELNKHAKQNENLKSDLSTLLNALEDQTSECISLRCQNQTIEEQIPFIKDVHELEMAEMKRLFERKRVDPTQFYRNELKRAINDIRNDFKESNENQQRELEAWYKVKADELQQSEEKRPTKDDSLNARVANKKLSDEISNNQKELADLLNRRKELEDKVRNLEGKLNDLRNHNDDTSKKQDQQIANHKNTIQDHLDDHGNLLTNMSILQFEINTFKRLTDQIPVKEKQPETKLNNEELMRRLLREKAKIGDVHVSIAWDNVNDLDLHVIEPSGEEISFSHRKSATGGELDVDMNAGAQRSLEPVENIYWPNGHAPKGHYKILVVYYSNHGSPDPTNYLVLAELNGQSLEFRGKMNYGDKPQIWEFEI